MARKPRRRKRPEYSREAPMTLDCTVIRESQGVARFGGLGGALAWCLGWIPSYRDHGRGRDRARFARFTALLGAILIATLTPAPTGVVIAGVLALSTCVFPIPHHRKTFWMERARGLHVRGRVRRGSVAAGVHWDGRKVSVRVEGRVIRSLRPGAVSHALHIGPWEDGVALGLVPEVGAEGAAIWIVSKRGLPSDAQATAAAVPSALVDPITCSPQDWEHAWEALTDPRIRAGQGCG